MTRLNQPALRRLILVLGTAAICLPQASVRFRGPESGLLYDPPTQSIRNITGLMGAAQLGDAVIEGVEWATVAPSGKVALYKKGDGLLAFSAQTASAVIAVAQAEAPDDVLWAGDSQSAVLLWPNSKILQRVAIDGAGVVSAEPRKEFGLDGQISAITTGTSDTLVAAIAGRGVYLVDLQKLSSRLLLPLNDCLAIVSSGDNSAVFAIDGVHGVLYRIGLGDEQPTVVSADSERLMGVTRMANASNGRGVLLANSETRKIYQWRAGDQLLTDVAALEAPVTVLRPIGRNSLFLLGHRTTSAESVQFYDDLRGDTIFVPFQGGGQ